MKRALLPAIATILSLPALGQDPSVDPTAYAREHYSKLEVRIPARDGVELFTSIYSPRDSGIAGGSPILLCRTPYSVGPYGPDADKTTIGPSVDAMESGFIVAYQDVRGCYLSGGTFVDVRPHVPKKQSPADIDESSDTWDTIDWLVKNVPGNNGRVGMWGISYPGFYAAAGMIDAHPALRAVSPQAPIADWFFDDFHHHGALFLPHAFNFLAGFGRPRPEPTTTRRWGFEHGTEDGYDFFLRVGPLSEANVRWFSGEVAFWDELVKHPNYDDFWKAREITQHLKKVAPAVLTVGGWFDAEDLFGALHTYAAVERQNPSVFNALVMGPWSHGGWSRGDGDRLGNVSFGEKTGPHYRKAIELAFFERELKGAAQAPVPEASVFETGSNRWRSFDAWPPKARRARSLLLLANGRLALTPGLPTTVPASDAGAETGPGAFDEFVSDPARPVPFTDAIAIGMTSQYMTDDQRFAARRPDVLVWQSDPVDDEVTLAGPLEAELWVSTDQEDADWIVKLVDVFPGDAPDPEWIEPDIHMAGYQMLVRSEVLRGRFREGYATPKPFVQHQPTLVRVPLQDVLHTFEKGHRIMIQVQSTWFPLVDRNPQDWIDNVFEAREGDHERATHRVYREGTHQSRVIVGVLEE